MIQPTDITNAVDSLLERYGQDTAVIPSSSLWLELGFRDATWRGVDRAYRSVGGKPLGSDYSPAWVRSHAQELADAINLEGQDE